MPTLPLSRSAFVIRINKSAGSRRKSVPCSELRQRNICRVIKGGSCLPRQTCCNSPFSMKMTYIFFILILLLSCYYSLVGGQASQVYQILELAFDHCAGAHGWDNTSITVIWDCRKFITALNGMIFKICLRRSVLNWFLKDSVRADFLLRCGLKCYKLYDDFVTDCHFWSCDAVEYELGLS